MININHFIKKNIEIRINELHSLESKPHYINDNCLLYLNWLRSLDIDDIYTNTSNSSNKNYPGLFYFDLNELSTNPYYLNHIVNEDLIYRLSSKSFQSNSNTKSNRLEGLNSILSGINYKLGYEFMNLKYIDKYKYYVVCLYVIGGQVFSDGNHRVCWYYLKSQNICETKIWNIIKSLDIFIKKHQIHWDNLHEVIQNFINNLYKIISNRNDDILIKKIENLFI